ncbi:MAG: hypothetical protein EBX15_05580 [Acidimicrobiia bacterium]|nr:hypothetical protein [Acidimicrobiia bacterium]
MLQPLERALHEMHEQLFDDDRAMVRLYGLYLVRETALGAFLDLENGNVTLAPSRLMRHNPMQARSTPMASLACASGATMTPIGVSSWR